MTRLACLFAFLLASDVAAQTAPPPVQAVGNYSLPASEPTPAPSPTPSAIPSVAPTQPPVPLPTPVARPTPRAIPTAEPDAEPTPRVAPIARPRASPTTAPVRDMPVDSRPPLTPAPTPAPARVAPPSASTAEPDSATPWWPWAVGAVLMLALLVAWLLHRRRPRTESLTGTSTAPLPEPVSAPPPDHPAPARRPWVELELHPRRGGLNLLSATMESEVVLRNSGDAAAEAVLVEATLLPARSGQDAELCALFARPVLRAVVTAFALAPGEERRVRVVSALPLAGIEALLAGDRAMLVPVVAANVTYRWADGTGQTSAAFVVGVERAGQAKLAPFWLDAPQMHEALAARAHSLAVRR